MGVKFERATLTNGLSIVAETDPDAHSSAVGFFVKTGARDEDAAVMGVSHFLEHMMFKGTERRSADDVNREFDEIGASYNAFTTSEITAFHAHVLPEHLEKATDILADILESSGFNTVTASNGEEGLERVLSMPEINLVISDIHMPVLDGLGLIRKLRVDDKSEIPVIVLSGNNEVSIAIEAINLGANDSGICRGDVACAKAAILHLVDAIGPGHRIWWPKTERAPVPVRSSRSSPVSMTRCKSSRYCRIRAESPCRAKIAASPRLVAVRGRLFLC